MHRWGLVPSDVPPAQTASQLETLTATPVEIVEADAVAREASRGVVRLPAEWEQAEAVVLAWPVLYPGLWKFYSDLVGAIAPVARVDLLVPHAIYAAAIVAYLGEAWKADSRIRFLVTATDDLWVRDYGPLTCLDETGSRVIVDATFDPPPAMPFANDDAFPTRYAAHEDFPCRQLPLHLEGGNLWSDGQRHDHRDGRPVRPQPRYGPWRTFAVGCSRHSVPAR